MLNLKKNKILTLLIITVLSFSVLNVGYSKNFDGSSEKDVERFRILSIFKSEIKSKFSKNEYESAKENNRIHPIKNKAHQDTCDFLYLYLCDVVYENEDDFSIYMTIASYIDDVYSRDEEKEENRKSDITKLFKTGKGNSDSITDLTIAMCKMCDIPAIRIKGENHTWCRVYLNGKWYYSDLGYICANKTGIRYTLSPEIWEDGQHNMKAK